MGSMAKFDPAKSKEYADLQEARLKENEIASKQVFTREDQEEEFSFGERSKVDKS